MTPCSGDTPVSGLRSGNSRCRAVSPAEFSNGRGFAYVACHYGPFVLLALAAFFSAQSGHAQSVYAPGGLFVHPTAFTPRAHQFSIYAAAFTQDDEGGTNDSHYPVALTYAPTDRMQVSALASYHQSKAEPSHTHLGAFLKYQLMPDTPAHPAFALTGAYAGNDHLESSIAGVFSHALLRGGRAAAILHVGAKWARTSDREGGVDDFGGFIGAQVPLSRDWDIAAETSTRLKFDRSSATAVGFMYHARSGVGISVGLVNRGSSSRMKPFFGVGFPIGH